jgi:hypothetical protein
MPMVTTDRLRWRGRRALQCTVLAVGLSSFAVADACTLDVLLRLTLEQLLALRVGQPGCPSGQSGKGVPQHSQCCRRPAMKSVTLRSALLPRALAGLATLAWALAAHSQGLSEYRLKAAFLYNFAAYTEWPAEVGGTLNVCIYGADPFGADADTLNGKKAGPRTLAMHRRTQADTLKGCQIVFIAHAGSDQVRRVLDVLRGQPVLTVADVPRGLQHGVALNMNLTQEHVSFEANLRATREARLELSSRLLRLATEVLQ